MGYLQSFSSFGGFPIKQLRQWALGSGRRLFSDEAMAAPRGPSLVPDTINIRSEKNAPRASVTQYGMTLGWNSKLPNVYMGGLMVCLQDEGHHDSTQFLPNLNFGGGLNFKTSPQSMILYLSNCRRADPNYFLTRVSIDNNNRRIEQWACLNPLIIPSTHDDPIFFCLRTKG